MNCSLPGSSVHGIFQERVLEWGAIAVKARFKRIKLFPRSLTVLTILHMLTVLHNYSNAKNSTHSANINYADKVLTIRTYAKYTNNTNSANTNYTIYANKLLTIPNMLTISMILSLLILATLNKKNKIKEEKN